MNECENLSRAVQIHMFQRINLYFQRFRDNTGFRKVRGKFKLIYQDSGFWKTQIFPGNDDKKARVKACLKIGKE